MVPDVAPGPQVAPCALTADCWHSGFQVLSLADGAAVAVAVCGSFISCRVAAAPVSFSFFFFWIIILCSSSSSHDDAATLRRCGGRGLNIAAACTRCVNSVCLVQVTSDSYEQAGGSVNGSGLRPFDVVIPFSFRKGEITGESGCKVC